jgi:hypothetical protein
MSPSLDTDTMGPETQDESAYDEGTLRRVMGTAESLMDSEAKDPVPDHLRGNNPYTETQVSTNHS